uniref:Transmembrane protein n=1 Tax=viral metagenome TaxID=1070528 RepID=A0A6C0KYM9_9ZZZZ|tara:strand:+ start:26211 stop:26969 length:759 start_codon:yes stop_codon:yes gene_type:complete
MTGETDEKIFKKSVSNTLKIFTLLMMIFVLIKTIVMFKSANSSLLTINSLRNISLVALAFTFFLFSYFTNIAATENKLICGEKNHKIAFYATILPFVFIFLLGIFAISIFPGWVRCFSNTFGSSLLSFCGLEANVTKELNPDVNSSNNNLYELYSKNPQILLNEIELNSDGDIPSEYFKEVGITIDGYDKKKKILKQYIYCKETIGEGIWQYLLGIITLLMSYNAILSENCNAFTVQKDDFKKYLNDKIQKN